MTIKLRRCFELRGSGLVVLPVLDPHSFDEGYLRPCDCKSCFLIYALEGVAEAQHWKQVQIIRAYSKEEAAREFFESLKLGLSIIDLIPCFLMEGTLLLYRAAPWDILDEHGPMFQIMERNLKGGQWSTWSVCYFLYAKDEKDALRQFFETVNDVKNL